MFGLEATIGGQRGVVAVNHEEDGVLKKRVELFKRGDIGFLRIGRGSQDDALMPSNQLLQAGCFFERMWVDIVGSVVVMGIVVIFAICTMTR